MDPTLETLLTVAGNAGVVIVLVEALKSLLALTPAQTDRFGPALAIVIGIVLAEFAAISIGQTGSNLSQAVLVGILSGSSAMGFYNSVKSAGGALKQITGGGG